MNMVLTSYLLYRVKEIWYYDKIINNHVKGTWYQRINSKFDLQRQDFRYIDRTSNPPSAIIA